MSNLLIVDRIEGDFALCEDEERRRFSLALADLPPGLGEGDCLRRMDAGRYAIDAGERERRRKKNADLFRRLQEQTPE